MGTETLVASEKQQDGFVSVEPAHGRYRITVRHAEHDADFLWLSAGEAAELAALLNSAIKPLFEGKPMAAAYPGSYGPYLMAAGNPRA